MIDDWKALMILVDSHCHLGFPEYASDLEAVKTRARQAGVKFLISVGTDLAQSEKNVGLAGGDEAIWAAVGIHPHEADKIQKDFDWSLSQLEELAKRPKVVAIGETGLDYYKGYSSPQNQEVLFLAQIKLALKLNKPLVLHIRDAYSDVLEILEKDFLPLAKTSHPGVAHSFGAGLKYAQRLIEWGFFIGINGIITFPNTGALLEVVEKTPLERLLIETDAPFLAPEPFRGRRNEPAFLVEVAKRIAQIKKLSVEEVAQITTQNARALFDF